MELNKIYDLWDRFDASSATKMELDMNGVHFALSKENSVGSSNVSVVNTKAVKEEQVINTNANTNNEDASLKEIKAPLVGTFYIAPSPDAKPFVAVGQEIKKGDVIGIIEAMKLMNEVVAKEDGIVASIHAEDGKMVEFGQVLVRLK